MMSRSLVELLSADNDGPSALKCRRVIEDGHHLYDCTHGKALAQNLGIIYTWNSAHNSSLACTVHFLHYPFFFPDRMVQLGELEYRSYSQSIRAVSSSGLSYSQWCIFFCRTVVIYASFRSTTRKRRNTLESICLAIHAFPGAVRFESDLGTIPGCCSTFTMPFFVCSLCCRSHYRESLRFHTSDTPKELLFQIYLRNYAFADRWWATGHRASKSRSTPLPISSN